MHRIDSANTAAVRPTPAAPGTPAYFKDRAGETPGTILEEDWLNAVQEELYAIATMGGAAADKSNVNQCKEVLEHVLAIYSEATAAFTGKSSTWLRAVIASATCDISTGDLAAVIACEQSDILGTSDMKAAIASEFSTADGEQTAVIASEVCAVSVKDSAIIAAGETSSGGCTAAGTRTLVAASVNCDGDSNAIDSVLLASANSHLDGVENGMIGCRDSDISANATNNVVLLASKNCDPDNGGGEEDYSVTGGYHASSAVGPDWRIESQGGDFHSESGNYNTGGLDFAEMMPNGDGVAHEPGRILTRVGKSAKLARRGDRVHGVLSVTPTIVGNAATLGWRGKRLRDEWGRVIYDDIEEVRPARTVETYSRTKGGKIRTRTVSVVDEAGNPVLKPVVDEDGKPVLDDDGKPQVVQVTITERVTKTVTIPERRKMRKSPRLNPDWDPKKSQLSRRKRPDEWSVVGWMGQVLVAVDATVEPNDLVVPGDEPGIGTAAAVGTGWSFRKHGRCPIECMEIVSPYDAERGYAIAFCSIG